MAKVEATSGYGGEVEMAGEGLEETIAVALTSASRRRARPSCTPYEDERVIAGQGRSGSS